VRSTIMDIPLTIASIMRYGTSVFGDREVVTCTEDGSRRRTYAEAGRRAARLANALRRLGVDHDVKEYPDANHSFLNHHDGWQSAFDKIGFGHHEESADDAWRRIFAFFDTHVRAP